MTITFDSDEFNLLICAVEAYLIMPENDPDKIGLDNHREIEKLLKKLNDTYYEHDY